MRRRKGDSPRMPRAAPRQVGSPAPVGNGGPERQRPGDGGVPPAGGGGAASESGRRTPPMLIAAKVLGATCLAGALATTGVLTTDSFAHHDPAGPATTTTEAPTTTTTTEAPVPTPPPAPTPVTLPPPTEPTVVPVAGAGTVVIGVQGPQVVVRDVNALPGWAASVERRAGDVDVLFQRGDRSFRFFASMVDRRLTSAIREVRADGDHRVTTDDGPTGRRGPGGAGPPRPHPPRPPPRAPPPTLRA